MQAAAISPTYYTQPGSNDDSNAFCSSAAKPELDKFLAQLLPPMGYASLVV